MDLSRFRGMRNTPQLAASFLGVALHDTARLAARSFIRETKNGVSQQSEIFGTSVIIFHLICMLVAVDLNDYILPWSAEINNIVADGMLASETYSSQSMGAQTGP
jgi:hypothetical protein